MNLVKLINIICSVSLCFGLESNNKPEVSGISIILGQKKHLAPKNQNKLSQNESIKLKYDLTNLIIPKITEHKSKRETDSNVLPEQNRVSSNSSNIVNNDSIKFQLDLNNLLPRISRHGPQCITHPITNLKARTRPVLFGNNRINGVNRFLNKQKVYNPVKNVSTPPPKPPKKDEVTKPTISAPMDIKRPTPEPKKPAFYIEINQDDEIDPKPDTSTLNLPIESRIKETVLTKLQNECSDGKKDKNDAIVEIMKDLPELIKSVLAERAKPEGNPIIIKNITEITLPIQRGNDIKIDTQVNNSTKKEVDTDSIDNAKEEKIDTKPNDKNCKDVMNLLLKPILQGTQNINTKNDAEEPRSPLQVSQADKEEIESIQIKLNNYSEIVEGKHELVNKTGVAEEDAKEEPLSPNKDQNVYNTYSTDTTPNIQATSAASNPNVYNTSPMYSTPVYPNVYTSNEIYGQYPYEYSRYPQGSSTESECNPNYSLPTENETKYKKAKSSNDKKNTTWKNWLNTEILIKTNNNHADCQYQRPTPMQYQGYPVNDNGYNSYYYQNHVKPMYRNYPYCMVPCLRMAY